MGFNSGFKGLIKENSLSVFWVVSYKLDDCKLCKIIREGIFIDLQNYSFLKQKKYSLVSVKHNNIYFLLYFILITYFSQLTIIRPSYKTPKKVYIISIIFP